MVIKNLFATILSIFFLSNLIGCAQGSLSHSQQPLQFENIQAQIKEKCSKITPVTVTSKEFINKESKYLDLKESIINHCKIDAVKQVIGAEIRANKKMNLDVTNSEIIEKYNELNIEKAKGYIDSYEVISERIVEMGDVSLLEIAILANVCVPTKKLMDEVVVIGNFISSDGKNNDDYRAILKTCLDKYGMLQIASFTPGEDKYYDIIVQGRLIETDITKGKREHALEQSIAADFISILSTKAGRELKRESGKTVKKIRAIVGLEAMKRYDNESISVIGQKIIEIPSNIKTDVAETNAIHGAIEIASNNLIKKLLAK